MPIHIHNYFLEREIYLLEEQISKLSVGLWIVLGLSTITLGFLIFVLWKCRFQGKIINTFIR